VGDELQARKKKKTLTEALKKTKAEDRARLLHSTKKAMPYRETGEQTNAWEKSSFMQKGGFIWSRQTPDWDYSWNEGQLLLQRGGQRPKRSSKEE